MRTLSLLSCLLINLYAITVSAQQNSPDSIANLGKMTSAIRSCKNDTIKLDLLFNIHYYQQALIGELNETNVYKFDINYTRQAILLATRLRKFDTLKVLSIDIGYIFNLRKEYDSSFVYYDNCLSIFEATGNYSLSNSITQTILYNNSILQVAVEENNKLELQQNKSIRNLTYSVIASLIVLLALMLYYIAKTRRLNSILTEQRDRIQKSKTEIDDSINYAQTIQTSIVSNAIRLKSKFPDSFVFFRPRDKVSGDFLWTYTKEHKVYLAVADCTGHGVPGALISIVGNFLLNEILSQAEYKSPFVVLNELHIKLVKALNQEDSLNNHNNDGMDIGILEMDTLDYTLKYSGANRSLVHIRNKEVKLYKGARKPVGGTHINYKQTFFDDEIRLQKDDLFYCYTDGLQDQIGEKSNQKFKSTNLLKLIEAYAMEPLDKQREIIEREFLLHMGNNRQTDDVLLVGLKL